MVSFLLTPRFRKIVTIHYNFLHKSKTPDHRHPNRTVSFDLGRHDNHFFAGIFTHEGESNINDNDEGWRCMTAARDGDKQMLQMKAMISGNKKRWRLTVIDGDKQWR